MEEKIKVTKMAKDEVKKNKEKKQEPQIPEKDFFEEETEGKTFTAEDFKESPIDMTEEGLIKSKNFILDFINYIQSSKFFTRCEQAGAYRKVSAKTVAKNFLEKVLATIGDVLGIVIDSIQDVFTATLGLLEKILATGGNLLCNLAKKIVRVLTLNKTLVA